MFAVMLCFVIIALLVFLFVCVFVYSGGASSLMPCPRLLSSF